MIIISLNNWVVCFFMILGKEEFFKFENQYLGIVVSFLDEYSPLIHAVQAAAA